MIIYNNGWIAFNYDQELDNCGLVRDMGDSIDKQAML